MKKTLLPLASLLVCAPLMAGGTLSHISEQQINADIRYLASDQLAGRKPNTPGMKLASDYIAKAFEDAGLQPMAGLKGYRQEFSLYHIAPTTLDVSINGHQIADDKLAVFADNEGFVWRQGGSVEVVHIGPRDNPRGKISQFNQMGKDLVIMVHPDHREYFGRFQHHLAGGSYKLALGKKNSAVLILSDIAEVGEFDIKVSNSVKQQTLANMVGVLPGKRKADELVLYSAHHDHIGVDTDREGDQIYNGANDDASGVTAVLNLARHFGQQKDNERSLVFVTFTAEEMGGFGSQYFSRQLDPDAIVAMFNIEMIGKPSKFGPQAMWMTGAERSDLDEIMDKALVGGDFRLHADPYPDFQLFYRSDNATLARLGVPAHSLSTTQLDKDKDYHQASDEVDKLDMSVITGVTRAIARGSQAIVSGEATPRRLDTSTVKSQGSLF